MKSVYMITHQCKPSLCDIVSSMAQALNHNGISVSAEPWLCDFMGVKAKELFAGCSAESCDAIVAVGGDGTILRANAIAAAHDMPLLGVNIGTVGFLTMLEPEGFEAACERLYRDDFSIETRMLLEAEHEGRVTLALNDVVISRGGYTRLIGVDAWVEDDRVGRFIGDGLIVSTPTGSTGYSLSAGGPIVCPDVDCILLTPICAHSLQHRPVITPPTQRVTVSLDDEHSPKATVSIDGQPPFELERSQKLYITRSQRQAHFICMEQSGFFSKIRYKLSEWSC